MVNLALDDMLEDLECGITQGIHTLSQQRCKFPGDPRTFITHIMNAL